MSTPATTRYDLTPFERWEAVTLHGERAGFLHRVLQDGVLTTRMAFQPTPAQRAAQPDLPERFLAQCVVEFAADGATWDAAAYEDSATEQRVRIERERAGVDAHTVPSYAEFLLLGRAAGSGVSFRRLEEASPLQGGLRVTDAELRPVSDDDGVTRVDLVSEGHVLGVHRVEDGTVVASDWGGGTVSALVPAKEQALESLPAELVAFADLPRA